MLQYHDEVYFSSTFLFLLPACTQRLRSDMKSAPIRRWLWTVHHWIITSLPLSPRVFTKSRLFYKTSAQKQRHKRHISHVFWNSRRKLWRLIVCQIFEKMWFRMSWVMHLNLYFKWKSTDTASIWFWRKIINLRPNVSLLHTYTHKLVFLSLWWLTIGLTHSPTLTNTTECLTLT